MSKAALTEITLKNLKCPPTGQITYWDALPGFGVRVSAGGAKSFVLVHGRRRERTTIGRYPTISLHEARTEAKRLAAEKTLGRRKDPSINVADAVALFLAACGKRNKPRTVRDYRRLLHRHLAPRFKGSALADVSKYEISKILHRLLDTPSEANHAFTAIRAFLRFCVRQGYLTHSPCEGMTLPAKLQPKTRVLTSSEIGAVVGACGSTPFEKIVLLCLLTGQRRSEIAQLRAEYINKDDRTVTLPAEIVKNNRPHTFPYAEMAAAVLDALPTEGYLFPAGNGTGVFNGWSKQKRQFDKKCQIAPWTLQDLRRTFATNLASLGTPPFVTEKILNHVSGTISGVAAIYNRYQFLDEMRAALTSWEQKLAMLPSSAR